MRFSLIDLLIALAVELLSLVVVAWAAPWIGFAQLSRSTELQYLGATLGLAVPLYLLITPTIYQRFRLFPLFLPKCSHCKRRPDGYRILATALTRVEMICSKCERTFELWLARPKAAEISKTMPSLLWSWPHSIGGWRIISHGEAE
jgi:hypothetical protein